MQMYRSLIRSIFVVSVLFIMLFLSTCQGGGKKSPAKQSPDKSSSVKKSIANYKTNGKFDPSKIFTDLNSKPIKYSLPMGIKGDPKKGQKIFSNTKTGNCAACHCTEDAKGCGDIGLSLIKYRSKLGMNKKKKSDDWLYQVIADKRYVTKSTVMPPSLPTKILSEQDIMDIISYLNTLK